MGINSVHTFMKQTGFMEYIKKRKWLKKRQILQPLRKPFVRRGFG